MSRRNVGKLGPRIYIAFIHHQRDACHCGESRQELGLLVFSCALGWAILRDLLCAEPCRTRNPATFCCANLGPITTWDSVAGPGRTPMSGNNSGRRQPGNSAVPSTVGRLRVDGFWIRDYRGGVRVGRPVGARWRSPVRGSARCP